MDSLRITVVTPTYNRAHTLPRLYDSLVAQTYRGFRWLVVDDGSTDGTAELLEGWRRDAPFPLDVVHQENGGMYVAINRGIERVETELCATIGSDDWYATDGLARLLERWDAIPEPDRAAFANVEGRTALPDGSLNGEPLPEVVVDADHIEADLRGWRGDTCGLWRTDVRAAFPFPEDLGRNVVERLVFYRVAQRYRTRFCADVVAHVEYQPGGLSDQFADPEMIRAIAPSWLLHARELLASDRALPLRSRARMQVNEVRYAAHLGEGPLRQWRNAPRRSGWLLALVPGLALYGRDLLRLRAGRRGA